MKPPCGVARTTQAWFLCIIALPHSGVATVPVAYAHQGRVICRPANRPMEAITHYAHMRMAARALPSHSMEACAISAPAAETRDQTSSRMLEQAQRFLEESRQREIDRLTMHNQQQAVELQRRALQLRWLWTVIVGITFVLAGTVYFLLRLRLAKSELQKQTGILQSVLDSMSDGVCVADIDSRILLVNPAASRIIGIPPVEMPREDWSRYYGLYLSDQATPYPVNDLPLSRAQRGESCDAAELFMRRDGFSKGRWLSITARPLLDQRGITQGGITVFSDITARKRAEQLQRSYSAQLTRAREEERKYIARELHDDLSQLLSVLRLQISLLRIPVTSDASTREQVQQMLALVDRIIKAARDLIADLRPAVLDLGIAAALEWLTQEFQTRNDIACDLRLDPDMPELDADQTINVFRIVQESLTNAARHASAKRVLVSLQVEKRDMAMLCILDDGVGFDPTVHRPKSLGLIGMKERARMLGGELTIRSNPGVGARVALQFPFHHAPHEPAGHVLSED